MMRAAPFALLFLCATILFSGYETLGVIDEREARDAAIGHELMEPRCSAASRSSRSRWSPMRPRRSVRR
jgi:hypothetical protein